MEQKIITALGSGVQSLPAFLEQLADRLLQRYKPEMLNRIALRQQLQEDTDRLRKTAETLRFLQVDLSAAGPPVTVKVCACALSPDDEEELSVFIRFRGDNDWHALSFYGRRVEQEGKVYRPLSVLALEEIRQFALNTRQWAERHGYSFELDETIGDILNPLEEAL